MSDLQPIMNYLESLTTELAKLRKRVTDAEGVSQPRLNFTPGSVLFAGSTGLPAQDNANFFWNDTNNTLAVPTLISSVIRPGGMLDISNTGAGNASSIELGSAATGNRYAYIDFHGDDTYTDFGLRLIRSNAGANAASTLGHRGTGDLEILTIDAAAIKFYTGSTLRMTVLSGGNVGIGTASPSAKLDVIDGYMRAQDGTNTAPTSGLGLELLSAGGTCYMQGYNRGTAAFIGGKLQFSTLDFVMNTVSIGRFSSNGLYLGGTVVASKTLEIATDSAGKPTTNTWQIISDAETKRNIKPYTRGRDLISQLRPIEFEYNGKKGTPEGETGVGVLAQEVAEFAPAMVRKGKYHHEDGTEEDRWEYQGNELQYAVVNALKEVFERLDKLEKP